MRTTRWAMVISTMGLLGASGCGGAPPPVTVPLGAGPRPVVSVAPPVAEPHAVKKAGPGDEAPAVEKPGLGTEWGETRRSEITRVAFERESPRRPFATASLLYNDDQGARALAGGAFSATYEMFDLARSLVKVGVRDENGRLFPGFVSGEKDVVVGEAGHRYTILVHNNSDRRLEVVLSVDGLDVLDGKPAAFDKRGYILEAHGDVEVDGFRQSLDAVAAFRFGSVRGSYAGQKYGDIRSVGTIGVALFDERGSMPFPWTPEEVRRRREANPFPGEFSSPPGF